ncbi:MAG: arylamine N-acetyltransferase family protein [Segniliparus sp.]|uniref:arylamine N-acetyltransferase family protein n=1 Tax=Segniliparus sp. TaxID=2804064 RepID=UPI003F324F7D
MSSATPAQEGTAQAASSVWRFEGFDLDRYFTRIGYTGGAEPTFETLRALQLADATSIPWDNIDMVLGRPAVLDPTGVLDKITIGRRGLTCEERTTLFAAALSALGFHVECRSARVRMGAKKITGLSHAVVWAEVDGLAYACDVGFGVGPLEPVRLEDGARSVVGRWEHAIRREDGEWVLSGLREDGWVDLSAFADVPRYPVDNLYTNHFLSTHPRSPFRKSPRVSRINAEQMVVLNEGELRVATPVETLSAVEVAPEDTPRVLEEEFGVVLGAEDGALVVARIRDMRDKPAYNTPEEILG